jgi:hypothetical protein
MGWRIPKKLERRRFSRSFQRVSQPRYETVNRHVARLVGGLVGSLTVTAGPGSVAGSRDVSGNIVTMGQLPQGGGATSPPAFGPGVTAAPGGEAGRRDATSNTVTIEQPPKRSVPPPPVAPDTRSP